MWVAIIAFPVAGAIVRKITVLEKEVVASLRFISAQPRQDPRWLGNVAVGLSVRAGLSQ